MNTFHQPAELNLATGYQDCSRCGIRLHFVDLTNFEDPAQARNSAISPEVEISLSPYATIEKGGVLPTNSVRCEGPQQVTKTKK